MESVRNMEIVREGSPLARQARRHLPAGPAVQSICLSRGKHFWRFSLVSWTSQFGSLPSAVHLSLKGGNKTYCIFPVPRALNRYLRWAVLFLPSQFLQPLAIHTKQTCACSLFVYLFPLSHALYTYSVYCPVNCMFSVHCTCTGIYGILVALSCSCPVRFCTISYDVYFGSLSSFWEKVDHCGRRVNHPYLGETEIKIRQFTSFSKLDRCLGRGKISRCHFMARMKQRVYDVNKVYVAEQYTALSGWKTRRRRSLWMHCNALCGKK